MNYWLKTSQKGGGHNAHNHCYTQLWEGYIVAIKKIDLEKMNELLMNGTTIAEIQRKFPKYDYWEVYWEVNDYSFLGKKRKITNRINKIAKSKVPQTRRELAIEARELLDELYSQLKINSKKLIEIDRVLRK